MSWIFRGQQEIRHVAFAKLASCTLCDSLCSLLYGGCFKNIRQFVVAKFYIAACLKPVTDWAVIRVALHETWYLSDQSANCQQVAKTEHKPLHNSEASFMVFLACCEW